MYIQEYCITIYSDDVYYITIYSDDVTLLPLAILNSVDYIDPTGRCVFRTTAAERYKVVFQMVCYNIL